MDEKQIKELLGDLVASAKSMLDLVNDKAMFGDDQESEMFMPICNSKQYYNLEQAVFEALDSGMFDD